MFINRQSESGRRSQYGTVRGRVVVTFQQSRMDFSGLGSVPDARFGLVGPHQWYVDVWDMISVNLA